MMKVKESNTAILLSKTNDYNESNEMNESIALRYIYHLSFTILIKNYNTNNNFIFFRGGDDISKYNSYLHLTYTQP